MIHKVTFQNLVQVNNELRLIYILFLKEYVCLLVRQIWKWNQFMIENFKQIVLKN